MGNDIKKEHETIRFMVRERLKARVVATTELPSENHLDDDTISAFFEGRLGDAESAPVITHLVSCSLCRHMTAQFAQFDADVSATTLPVVGEENPTSLRQWFEDFRTGFAGGSTEEVFAYQNPADVSEEASKPTDQVSTSDDETVDERTKESG
ncbi:MAG TPA: hypothetical protein VIV66_05450 [Pyrinomonadaceae bacterium]